LERTTKLETYTLGEIQNQMNESRLRWTGYVERMDKYRIPKRFTGNEGKRKKTQGQTMHMMDIPREM
jgi:hypothetical protein